MSQHDHSAHDHDHAGHGHDDHGHGHEDNGPHSTFKGYAIGFVLAVILTAIPFWLVMDKVIANTSTLGFVVLGFAAVQVVVHMIYFLHMNGKVEGGWSLLALLFTMMVLVIMMAGSIWVMYHMNKNMMPTMTSQDMRNMP